MSTSEIRELLHEYINNADERLINLIYETIQSDMKEDYDALNEGQKKLLDERLTAYQSNPSEGSNWEEVKNRIRKQL